MNAHTAPVTDATFDQRALRDVLGHFATGVVVVTTQAANGAPIGLTVNSFSSVSLDPPLVAWGLDLNAPSLSAFRDNPFFTINIMCEESKDLALNFARPAPDKFAGIDWHEGLNGGPVFPAAAAVIECQTETRIPGGDHEVYLGRVIDFHGTEKSPLLFHKGKFATLGTGL